MKEKVEKLCSEICDKISKISSIQELNNIKVEYMGKKGIITELQSGIKDAADKKEYGMQVNLVRNTFNEAYDTKLKELNEQSDKLSLAKSMLENIYSADNTVKESLKECLFYIVSNPVRFNKDKESFVDTLRKYIIR